MLFREKLPLGLSSRIFTVLGSFGASWAVAIVLALMLFTRLAIAQPVPPFQASMSVTPAAIAPGQMGDLIIHVVVQAGFHIQSNTPLDKFLQPTLVEPVGNANIKFSPVQYPKPVIIVAPPDVTSMGKLSIFDGDIKITIPFKVLPSAAAGRQVLAADVTAQACDATSCVAPVTRKLNAIINIKGIGKPAVPPPASHHVLAPAQQVNAAGQASVRASPMAAAQSDLSLIESRPYAPATSQPTKPFWQWILIALLAGLILNVMPCVLPVIPLKVLSLVQQSHGEPRIAVRHGLIYSAGVVFLFLLLAVLMIVYRTGTQGGHIYGSQFQHPVFMLTLAMAVLVFGLSLLGVWTLSPPRFVYKLDEKREQAGGYVGSFGMGVLATALATPCSAPFLGGLLAWVIHQSDWQIVLFLATVGVGMSLPFLVLAGYPSLLRFVPRAGRWSELLKQFIGLAMLAVALYLLTTMPNRAYLMFGLEAAMIVAVACWLWGQGPSAKSSVRTIWGVRAAAILLASAGIWLAASQLPMSATGAAEPRSAVHMISGRWYNFSVAALDAGLASGHPVVVDFTAHWCINCHYIKATVLESAAAKAAYKKYHVILLRADMTGTNPPVNLLLKKLGGYAIPFLAIFSPARPYRPATLRDYYSVDHVSRDVAAAAG